MRSWISGVPTVLVRRRAKGAKLLRKSSDSPSPAMPTTMRITPTILMSMPATVALTAHARIAPIAIRPG